MNSLFRHQGIKAGIAILIAGILLIYLQDIACGQQASPKTKGPAPSSEKEKETIATDPLGRETPRGTLIGFMKDAGSENYKRAASYLDTSLPPKSAEQLVIQLYTVLNLGLSGDVSQLSDKPEGDLADGLERNREQVGIVETASRSYAIMLERVQKGKEPPLWLFSSQTLKFIPELYRGIKPRSVDRYIPEVLKETKFLKYPLWQWITFILIIPLSFAFAWFFTWIVMMLVLLTHRRTRAGRDGSQITLPKGPLRVLALSLGFYIASLLSYTLLSRLFWERVSETLLIVGITWLCLYLVDPFVRKVFGYRELTSSGTIAVSRLLDKTLKTTVVIIGLLSIFYMAGINVTAVLTGLGIGGIAIAFAAQKTLENFFGGIMIVWDQPLRVGDFCRCDTHTGTVEDIGLRSTRLRTPDRTIVSIPNGQLATMSLENFSVRDKILFHQKILLHYGTTFDQIHNVMRRVQSLLESDPRLEKDGWVRFTGFRDSGLEVEIWAYFLSTDYSRFQLLQQELLLHVMKAVEEAGTSLSVPSRITYVVDSAEVFGRKPAQRDHTSKMMAGQGELPLGPPSGNSISGRANKG